MDRTLANRILSFTFSPIFLSAILLIFLYNYIFSMFLKRRSLPPGPMPWPIIGNILQLEPKLHISMAKFAQRYGPLFSLRLGTQVVIVASSPSAAAEILKANDRLLSARSPPLALPYRSHVLERISIVWNSPCSDQWKLFRSIGRTELFSAKAIESQAELREKKMKEMIEFLKRKEGKEVNIGEAVFATVFNTLSNLVFSKDFIGLGDEKGSRLRSTMWRLIEAMGSPNLADFYPILEPLDLQGLKRKASDSINEIFGVWEIYIKERKERTVNAAQITDFLDVFLANGFDDDQINWLALEFLTAGTDTSTATIEWAMAELLKNKQAMKTLEEELERAFKIKTIDECEIARLPYLNACVKETMRLHPATPLLAPRRALESCEVMNHTIPKNARILVNVWAIGRDSSCWEDPLVFKPERFLSNTIDFKGHNFELLPFGSGRRICPGMPMVSVHLPLILGCLIHYFDWSLPKDQNLDMSEKFGLTLQKEQPLHVIPKAKF